MKNLNKAAILGAALIFAIGMVAVPMIQAQLEPPMPPELQEGAGIIKNLDWAIVLGKALFWDQQVGSDGQSCASCHFHAGADIRITNALSPGFLAKPEDHGFGCTDGDDCNFNETASGNESGPNYTLNAEDFPFHQLANEEDRNSPIRISTNDRVSSPGSFDSLFIKTRRFKILDKCGEPNGDVFYAGDYAARMVEPRNTPTTINAAFNHRNFWDGRANNIFNGVGVFGYREIEDDPRARIVVSISKKKAKLEEFAIANSSLASQAVGPVLSNFEMSCEGRTFADVGHKMVRRRPLVFQKIHRYDSVFGKNGPRGNLRHRSGRGLKYRYDKLIKKAFDSKYWKTKGRFLINEDGQLKRVRRWGYTQMELNFSLFWGISVMLYERTLVSDNSRFDVARDAEADCFQTPVPQECLVNGLWSEEEESERRVFGGFGGQQTGRCVACHGGILTTAAAFQEGETFDEVQRIGAPDDEHRKAEFIHDTSFFNIGSRPVVQDLLLGATETGYPLSFSRQFLQREAGMHIPDSIGVGPCDIGGFGGGSRPFDCTDGVPDPPIDVMLKG